MAGLLRVAVEEPVKVGLCGSEGTLRNALVEALPLALHGRSASLALSVIGNASTDACVGKFIGPTSRRVVDATPLRNNCPPTSSKPLSVTVVLRAERRIRCWAAANVSLDVMGLFNDNSFDTVSPATPQSCQAIARA